MKVSMLNQNVFSFIRHLEKLILINKRNCKRNWKIDIMKISSNRTQSIRAYLFLRNASNVLLYCRFDQLSKSSTKSSSFFEICKKVNPILISHETDILS